MSDETTLPSPSDALPSAWTALAVSVRGFNHERSGQENQDASAFHLAEKPGDPLFLSVADGHGSPRSFRSATGSALAVKMAIAELQKLVASHESSASFREKRAQARKIWPLAMVKAWYDAVRADLKEKPFTFFEFAPFPEPQPVLDEAQAELPHAVTLSYGATILAVAVTEDYIFYAQLGDGDILTVLPDGRVRRPFPAQHTRFATTTPSLCSQYAEFGVRVSVRPIHEKSPVLIILSTDGYANSFEDEAAFRKVGADLLHYLQTEGIECVRENLEGWLRTASINGNGDDTTVGLIVRRDILAVPAPSVIVPGLAEEEARVPEPSLAPVMEQDAEAASGVEATLPSGPTQDA